MPESGSVKVLGALFWANTDGTTAEEEKMLVHYGPGLLLLQGHTRPPTADTHMLPPR